MLREDDTGKIKIHDNRMRKLHMHTNEAGKSLVGFPCLTLRVAVRDPLFFLFLFFDPDSQNLDNKIQAVEPKNNNTLGVH